MPDYINHPQCAKKCYEQMSESARSFFKRFSNADFVAFAQTAYEVLNQNKAYLAHKKQLNLTKAHLSQNQSVIARNAKWILRGLDACDFKRGWLYQGEYTPSLKYLKIRIEKMATAYGFTLPTNDKPETDQAQRPVRLFQVFHVAAIQGEKENIESRKLDWASRQTLDVFVRANRSFIRSL